MSLDEVAETKSKAKAVDSEEKNTDEESSENESSQKNQV
jgi:hypothetical protein